ncbi:conserved exported protein of unknown function [Pseudorhizobium banfieldiae]|uniref:DUF2147 domain-containing protein n=2 Tax=Pseudorhizobium TaxID=1903858 RepID=L0NC78_9HYPH|nr:conserved exported protein of unknown function [Pseudorhizobium banfieldiae]
MPARLPGGLEDVTVGPADTGMEKLIMRHVLLAAAFLLSAGFAHAAEPLEGNWKTASGETATIGKCGNAFCVTLKTGKHAGKQIGKLSGTGGTYKGEITDPAADKTYSGSGTVSGNSLKMKGCVMAVLCKTQTWTRL